MFVSIKQKSIYLRKKNIEHMSLSLSTILSYYKFPFPVALCTPVEVIGEVHGVTKENQLAIVVSPDRIVYGLDAFLNYMVEELQCRPSTRNATKTLRKQLSYLCRSKCRGDYKLVPVDKAKVGTGGVRVLRTTYHGKHSHEVPMEEWRPAALESCENKVLSIPTPIVTEHGEELNMVRL